MNLGAKNLVCVDLSSAIDVHKKNFLPIPKTQSITRLQGSIDSLPFKNDYFDAVYCMGVIQHTPSPLSTFRELIRVLKPGGDFVIDAYLHNPYKRYSNLQFLFWRPFFKMLGDKLAKKFIDSLAP